MDAYAHRAFPGDMPAHIEGFVVFARALRDGRPHAFERAARDLHLDVSVLRRRLRALAEFLGASLVAGRGARLALTAEGERLLVAGGRVLKSLQDLRDDVRASHERIELGCTGTIATELVPFVIAELERAPRPVDVRARRLGTHACVRALVAGDVSVGVVRAHESPRGVASERLCDDRLWLALPRGHALIGARRPNLDALAREPLVTFGESSQTRARVMSELGPRGVRIRAEVDRGATALAYVRVGLGIALLSRLPGDPPRERNVVMRDVTALFPRLAFYAATAFEPSAGARAVVAALRRRVLTIR